ncbi:MAG TPA: TRAM domain-containing protein, partial [Candidatus Faecivicinus avistercoris]|nr:TRAM domain-containing protein [Candidatus Faecivicinus avistercoris]
MNNIAGGRSAEEIRITGAGSELQGVGRLSDGRAVFVPGALPGETVRAEIVRAAKRYCEARLVEVLDPSPERRAPDCPHYGVCGGCQGRHMTYAETLRLKRGRVRDALVRIGGLDSPEVFPVIGCDSPDRTRNKAEFPIGRDAGGRIAIGAHMAGSRTVVPLDDCLLQKPAAVRAMRWLSERLDGLSCARHLTNLVTRVNRRGELMAVLCADAPVESAVRALVPEMVRALPELRSLYFLLQNRRPSHALDGRCMHLWGQRALDDELMSLTFSLSPQSFFQVNAEQAERLYEVALAAVGLGAEDARAHHQPEAGYAVPQTELEMGDSSLPAGQTPARDASARVSRQPEAGCAVPQTGSEMADSSLPAGQTPARDVSVRVSHRPEDGCAAPRTGSEMGDSSLPAGQTLARDASVRVPHRPEAGCAASQTGSEMGDSSLPAGRTSARDASVRVPHQPEAGYAVPQTGPEMADSSLPAGQTPARDASVRISH